MLYAGNVGFSQSLDLLLDAARALPEVTFLINGDGAARRRARAAGRRPANVRFGGYVPDERLGELLATGDVHVVPLRAGLGDGQRAVEDLLDPGRRPARRRRDRRRHRGAAHPRRRPAPASSCRPTTRRRSSPRSRELLADPARRGEMGDARPGRGSIGAASPAAVAGAYERLVAVAGAGRPVRARRSNRRARR